MTVTTSVEVIGIKDALRELNNLDKTARRKVTSDFKRITKPIEETAKFLMPKTAPLSGMNRAWKTKSGYQMFPWQTGQDKIISKVSGRRPKMFAGHMTDLATFYVRFQGPNAVLFDMAGKGTVPTTQGSNMVRALTSFFGPPSRVLWKAYDLKGDQVVSETQKLIDEMMDEISRRQAELKSWRS
jgi:hypothetical protein